MDPAFLSIVPKAFFFKFNCNADSLAKLTKPRDVDIKVVHLKSSQTVVAIVTGLDDIARYWFLRRVQYVFDKPVFPSTFDQSLNYDNINEILKEGGKRGRYWTRPRSSPTRPFPAIVPTHLEPGIGYDEFSFKYRNLI